MPKQFGVRLKPETGQRADWGPFPTAEIAERYAAFVTDAIDPAEVFTLMDPLDEAMNGYYAEKRYGRGLPDTPATGSAGPPGGLTSIPLSPGISPST